MKNSKINVEARQENILKYVRKAGEVHSNDLANAFQISLMTVRRDLEELAQRHLLKRTHGGACTLDYVKGNKTLSKNIRICRDAISRYAATLVKDGDKVFINGSKTALKMLDYVGDKKVTGLWTKLSRKCLYSHDRRGPPKSYSRRGLYYEKYFGCQRKQDFYRLLGSL